MGRVSDPRPRMLRWNGAKRGEKVLLSSCRLKERQPWIGNRFGMVTGFAAGLALALGVPLQVFIPAKAF